MTPQAYQEKGYKVSLQLEQAVIDNAEAEAKSNYIVPIVGTFDTTDTDQVNALAILSVIRMAQSQVFATRSGGKEKRVNESYTETLEAIIGEYGRKAHAMLEVLRQKEESNPKAKVVDSLGIYLTTSFFYI